MEDLKDALIDRADTEMVSCMMATAADGRPDQRNSVGKLLCNTSIALVFES